MENKSRGSKCGNSFATWVNYTINTIPKEKKEEYKSKLIEELNKYSFDPKKDKRELDKVDSIDLQNPVHLAKLIKENINLFYQKQTARRFLDSLLSRIN